MGEKGSWGCCLSVELILFGSCCCLDVGTGLGDTGGVPADDMFEAEFVEVTLEGFPESGVPLGKEEVINPTTSAEIL